MHVEASSIGIMGTGSKPFRCGLAHSSGIVYLGTYGPQPAIVWKYDPRTGHLSAIAEPGEYQLDGMVEAPDGAVYIGTAYKGLVYRLDPTTDTITSLGTPPVDSTSWIFTMLRTRAGEIYGAKGVGLFRLDWQRQRLEAIGVVPGDHTTPGPNASMPITRQLEEAPDGRLWGDTNRWLFRFDPRTHTIEPLVDMAAVDGACYALFLPFGPEPTADCHFALFPRFSGQEIAQPFYAFRSATGHVEHLHIEGWRGRLVGHPQWHGEGQDVRLLVPTWHEAEARLCLTVVNPFARRIEGEWAVEGQQVSIMLVQGEGGYAIGGGRGTLLQKHPAQPRLTKLAENPMPVVCRSLGMSPRRILGAHTYDCGYLFTRDLNSGHFEDHGKVWLDDHRANYGPATFAGEDDGYFVSNHGEGMPGLWATDLRTNRHWRAGEPAVQLVRLSDGTVWGTTGPNPSRKVFDANRCWLPSWQARPGTAFRYVGGSPAVEMLPLAEPVGVLCEAPDGGQALLATGLEMQVWDMRTVQAVDRLPLPATGLAAACDPQRQVAYLTLADGGLYAVTRRGQASFALERLAETFTGTERGFFVLPQSGRVVGVAGDGSVTVWHPAMDLVRLPGPAPLPAGPAVDPTEDAWYFADTEVMAYRLID